jgi:putative nucleotidyltransferase with HDIG domain
VHDGNAATAPLGGRGLLDAALCSLAQRDRTMAGHSAAVAGYARELAMATGASVDQQQAVHTAGLLHDIGKVILSDSILQAKRGLSEQDWELVKRHPAAGAEIVGQVPGYELIARAILHHHERIDGTGYPYGLSGNDIPWISRVISVVDTYDVMTARDSYNRPRPVGEAVAELQRVAGSQLDAGLVGTFVELTLERRLAVC